MDDLGSKLTERLRGRICLLGLGNEAYEDDGFGVQLGRAVSGLVRANVVLAGATPERWLATADLQTVDHVVFMDAVNFGAPPGSVILLGAADIEARYPQVSTHKLSLGLLATWAESNGHIRAWLLGAQPFSLGRGEHLSSTLQSTLDSLADLLVESLGTPESHARAITLRADPAHLAPIPAPASPTLEAPG